MQQISITALAPVIRQSIDSFNERLQTENESHIVSASYGFDTCKFVLRGDTDYLRSWFRAGLIRDIVWRSPSGQVIWNGYVQSLTLQEGGMSRSKSIKPMANRIYYVYSALDTSTNPPTVGAQTTITLNDTASQDSYGIKQATISGGQITTTAANIEANTALTEMSRISIDEVMTSSSGAPPSLSIRCAGYAHMMMWWNYSQTISSSTANLSAIISAILAADPNSVINTSAINIDANTTQAEQYYNGDRPAWNVIRDLADRGGAANNRWVAGVYENRQLIYKQAETFDSNFNTLAANKYLTYQRNPADFGDRIFDEAGRELLHWNTRPDRLIYTSGYGRQPQYIEQSIFTAPYHLQIKSSDVNPLRNIVVV